MRRKPAVGSNVVLLIICSIALLVSGVQDNHGRDCTKLFQPCKAELEGSVNVRTSVPPIQPSQHSRIGCERLDRQQEAERGHRKINFTERDFFRSHQGQATTSKSGSIR